jgi:DNA-binding transcriptional ArsR family regulator
MNSLDKANISWDFGTAYELFISLHVLHEPEYYGIRASWAAGIRSRIPAVERKLLEEVIPFSGWPVSWVHKLPAPKDAISALWSMRQIPAAERMIKVFELDCDQKPEWTQAIMNIAARRAWGEADLRFFQEQIKHKGKKAIDLDGFKRYLDWWARPDEFGDGFLAALQAYHTAFFEDEEKRIAPVMKAGLEHARELAKSLSVSDLITELSQGIRFEEEFSPDEIIIAPSYWPTPLVVFEKLDEQTMLFLFGARPADMSAIPGELVPDGLLRTLKALADPTRLKILNYLSGEDLTPSELSRRLNLRAPTVTHHLAELRLSGLVNLTIRGQEKVYHTRREALQGMMTALESFLESK